MPGSNVLQCAVPENIHTPPNRRDWNFLGVGGSVRPKNVKKCMKLNGNLQTAGGVLEKIPSAGGYGYFLELHN